MRTFKSIIIFVLFMIIILLSIPKDGKAQLAMNNNRKVIQGCTVIKKQSSIAGSIEIRVIPENDDYPVIESVIPLANIPGVIDAVTAVKNDINLCLDLNFKSYWLQKHLDKTLKMLETERELKPIHIDFSFAMEPDEETMSSRSGIDKNGFFTIPYQLPDYFRSYLYESEPEEYMKTENFFGLTGDIMTDKNIIVYNNEQMNLVIDNFHRRFNRIQEDVSQSGKYISPFCFKELCETIKIQSDTLKKATLGVQWLYRHLYKTLNILETKYGLKPITENEYDAIVLIPFVETYNQPRREFDTIDPNTFTNESKLSFLTSKLQLNCLSAKWMIDDLDKKIDDLQKQLNRLEVFIKEN